MIPKSAVLTTFAVLAVTGAFAQDKNVVRENAPIYRVTVVERTVDAVNYRYRNGPTKIDFRGTVLMPLAKGDAVIESKSGRTDIVAHFEHLGAPTRFGAEYLAYVVWAITPEGHAKNLGEIIAGGSDDAKIHVTTDLQAFGLLVTAEPYSAVRQPSDVVVLQNQIRPDTQGKVQPIQARAELLPRGHYTYNKPVGPPPVQGPKQSMDRYEAVLEVYQAQNAVQIAGAMGAGKYAPETFNKAELLLRTANDLQMKGRDRSTVVMTAREAAQTAEDARAIAIARKQEEEVAQARADVANERQLRLQAEAEVQRARAEAAASKELLDAERAAARSRGEAPLTAVLPPPPPQEIPSTTRLTSPVADRQQNEMRVRILHDLQGPFQVLDSPRGLVVTVPDSAFRGSDLTPSGSAALERIVLALVKNPGLVVTVEGNSDAAGINDQFPQARAIAVRDALVSRGTPGSIIQARSVGASRPLVANTTAVGREQNRRVEITVSGDPIGSVPYWDKTYPLVGNR